MKNTAFSMLARVKSGKLAIVGAVLAASMCLTTAARADSVTGSFYYQYLGPYTTLSLGSAPTTAPVTPATVTFTVNGSGNVFNFGLSGTGVAGDVNLNGFLTHGGDTVSSLGAAGTDNINNGVFVFTGFTTLVAGQNYEFTHDDGMMLYLSNGGAPWAAISSAGATAADTDYFHVATTGTYSFEVIYAEVNGGPAVLNADIMSSATPEPSSLLLLGTGLLGLAFFLFRKNRPAGLVLHS
jgi:hypothetical protein